MQEWRTKVLKKSDPRLFRFKITVKYETRMAWLLIFDDIELWVPKTVGEVGIEPNGQYYCVDLPEWFTTKNKLT
jgi:hypothetical protein